MQSSGSITPATLELAPSATLLAALRGAATVVFLFLMVAPDRRGGPE